MARLITGLDAARVRENAERIRSEIGDAELLAAVKYVPLEELGVLAEAGVTLLGRTARRTSRPRPRRTPASSAGTSSASSRAARSRTSLPHVELIHSVASDSALRRLEQYGTPETRVLVEVDVAGEEAKAGIAPAELGAFIERCPVEGRRA